jgi:enoyl-CoA hydratase/carnithine racemase
VTVFELEHQNPVVIIKLDRQITNAINLELVNGLTNVIREVKSDSRQKALVLSSSNQKFFSIGFDIPELITLDKQDFKVFYRKFNQLCLELFTLPKPTVSAISGHAIAGGCILTLCCDFRIISGGRTLMGLNEVKLGVPVPYLAHSILVSLVGNIWAAEIVEKGDFFPAAELLEMGLVDRVVNSDEVLTTSMEQALSLSSIPADAYELNKKKRVETTEVDFLRHRDEKQDLFIRDWFSADARRLLKEAMEKF